MDRIVLFPSLEHSNLAVWLLLTSLLPPPLYIKQEIWNGLGEIPVPPSFLDLYKEPTWKKGLGRKLALSVMVDCV